MLQKSRQLLNFSKVDDHSESTLLIDPSITKKCLRISYKYIISYLDLFLRGNYNFKKCPLLFYLQKQIDEKLIYLFYY